MFDILPTTWIPFIKFAVPAITILLLLLFVFLRTRRVLPLRVLLTLLLAGCAVVAANEYLRGNYRHQLWLNSYEFYHYYMGAKYMDELGYTNLYNATLVADQEARVPRMVRTARDLNSGRIFLAENFLAFREDTRALFSEARWREFYRDITFFRNRVSYNQWQQQLNDKGYNATPVWTMLGGTLANLVSTEDSQKLQRLVYIDVGLLLLVFAGVTWAYGPRAALLLVIFMGTHYLMSHNTLRAAFIRLDWLACLALAPCFLKKGYPAIGGCLLAWATLSRIFPGIFIFGIVARLGYELVRYRQTHREAQDCLVGFCLTGAVLVLMSLLYAGGTQTWVSFFEKAFQHDSEIAPWRIGFKYVFLMTWDTQSLWGTYPTEFFAANQWAWWGIQILVLGVCAFLMGRMETHEAVLFSFIPAYFFFAPTYYYYVMLMIPMLFFATRMDRPMWSLGLMYIFITGMLGHVFFQWWDRGYRLFFVISCMIGILALYMLVLAAHEQWRQYKVRKEIQNELDWLDSDIPQETSTVRTVSPDS